MLIGLASVLHFVCGVSALFDFPALFGARLHPLDTGLTGANRLVTDFDKEWIGVCVGEGSQCNPTAGIDFGFEL